VRIKLTGVHLKGRRRRSDFALSVAITDRGVYWDRLSMRGDTEVGRTIIIGSTHRGARRLGQWLLDNVPDDE
jgi:hypothetical protein